MIELLFQIWPTKANSPGVLDSAISNPLAPTAPQIYVAKEIQVVREVRAKPNTNALDYIVEAC